MTEDEDFVEYPSAPQIAVNTNDDGAVEAVVRFSPPSREEIADALARRMYADYGAGKDLRAAAAERFESLVRTAVDEAAERAIGEALGLQRQPTDEFGTPIGTPRTFSQMIGEQVKAWQDETVDPHTGNPKAKDHWGGTNGAITRAEYLVRKVGAAEFKKMAEEAVSQVRTEAKARVAATIKETVASSLSALVR